MAVLQPCDRIAWPTAFATEQEVRFILTLEPDIALEVDAETPDTGDNPQFDLPAGLLLLINVILLAIFVVYMTDLKARGLQAVLITLIWGFVIVIGRRYPAVRTKGWNFIMMGLNLVAFGLIISILHEFYLAGGALDQNSKFWVFLEQIVGTAVGFALLGYGLFRWIPSFLNSRMLMNYYVEKLNEKVKVQKEELTVAVEKANQADELRRLKEFRDRVIATIPSALLVLDRNLKVLSVNRQFTKAFGGDADEMQGKDLGEVLPSDKLRAAAEMSNAENSVEELTLELKDVQGSERAYALTVTGETREFLLCVLADVTERIRAEGMEKQLQSQLLQSEKLSALGELVSGVAHELNNPLAIISGYSELMLEDDDMPDQAKELIQEISKSSYRCKKIVENLLAFARQHKPERESCDINNIVNDALQLRAHQLRVDNIKQIEELDKVPYTVADPYQLQQVFFNIINNAYQAMKGFRKDGNSLTVRTGVVDEMIRVEIRDNGPGMPEEVRSKIFDPFFTTKPKGEGTGLGLSITYGIIEEHGGKIRVESEAGAGTAFIIDLPISQDAGEAPVKKETRTDTSGFEGKRVLVIDDEETIADVCRMGLQRLGCLVEVSDNGPDAMARLAKQGFDLIISDMRMPGMDGPEIHAAVQEKNPVLADKIIFMTGDTLSPDTKSFLEKSGNTFLNKPFVMEELKAAVAKHFD